MAITYAQARAIVQKHVADSSDPTFIDQCLDTAILEFARAKRWPELMVRAFFNTRAAYSTGTVAVTEGGTTWTLTGGTFPTAAETDAYRIALSTKSPWYTVATRAVGGGSVETTAYQDDTETESGFIVYKSQYSMPSNLDRVEEMWLHKDGDAIKLVNAATDAIVTQFWHYPSGPGYPTHFYNMERDSSGNRQIFLGPNTPDDVYRVEYTYRKKATAGDILGNFDATRWRPLLALTLSLAYAPEFYDRSLAEYQKYRALLRQEWGDESETETQGVEVGGARLHYPVVGSGFPFIGRGRLAD